MLRRIKNWLIVKLGGMVIPDQCLDAVCILLDDYREEFEQASKDGQFITSFHYPCQNYLFRMRGGSCESNFERLRELSINPKRERKTRAKNK